MDPENFVHYLRLEMAERKWTQKDLAQAIGVSEPQLSRWMRGVHSPGALTMTATARLLRNLPKPQPDGGLVAAEPEAGFDASGNDELDAIIVDAKTLRREMDLLIVRLQKLRKNQ